MRTAIVGAGTVIYQDEGVGVFAAKYIETVTTFPGMFVNTLEYTQDDVSQVPLEFQTINIDFDGENINGLYNAIETTE